MLVLSRKPNEKIKIGDDIEITIVSVSGDSVRVGIEAPKHIKILRAEVYEEIKEQNAKSISNIKETDNLKNLLKTINFPK